MSTELPPQYDLSVVVLEVMRDRCPPGIDRGLDVGAVRHAVVVHDENAARCEQRPEDFKSGPCGCLEVTVDVRQRQRGGKTRGRLGEDTGVALMRDFSQQLLSVPERVARAEAPVVRVTTER